MNTATMTATPATTATAALVDNKDNVGNVFPYNSAAVPAEISGLRIIAKTFKQSEKMKADGKEAKQNVYCRVPTAHITVETVTERIEDLAPFIVLYLQGIEDKAIQEYMAKDGLRVFTDTLSIDKCIASLEEAGNTGLNGEQIITWFDDTMATALLLILVGKLGYETYNDLPDLVAAKVTADIQAYLDIFVSLASGKTHLTEPQRNKLTRCLELTGADTSSLGVRFIARFNKMAQKEQDSLDSLGDLEL